jgi:hypothetical protein
VSAREELDALIEVLLVSSNPAIGPAITKLCQDSARKAIGEVLDFFVRPDHQSGHYKVITLYISEHALREIVNKAVERCCE